MASRERIPWPRAATMLSDMTRTDGCVAAIDIGTNSVLLTVCDAAGRPLVERATITRLGQGVDRTRRLSAEGMKRTLDCLARYADALRAQDAGVLAVVGTSAMRDAENGDAFRREVGTLLGAPVEIISGQREAELTAEGALVGIPLSGPCCVVDIGGGSTELIDGTSNADHFDVASATSLNIGSVRLTERHLTQDPPTPGELSRVRDDLRSALASVTAPRSGTRLVGVAGTVTSLAAIQLGLPEYTPSVVHGSVLTASSLRALMTRLACSTLADRQRIPSLDPARADVIIAGGLILLGVLEWARAEDLLVSDRGVRWGLIAELLRKRE